MAVVGDVLLILIFILAGLLGLIVFLYWGYRRARRLGYRPLGATIILLLSFAVGIFATAALQPQNTTSVPLLLWRFIVVPMLLSGVALALLLFILPRRTIRVFGQRKTHFPFRGLGRLFQILAVAVVVLIAIGWLAHSSTFSDVGQNVSFTIAMWAGGVYLIRCGKAHQVPAFDEVFQSDSRPPVLYLRAFNQESQFFIIGTKAQYRQWAKSFHAAISRSDQKIGITLEEYLAQDLNQSIGPFVALGSPEDYLAPPGALRLYAKDDEWKARFDELARRAACIIVEVSKSDNLRWEFEHLRAEGLPEKLFILTRPSEEGSRFAWWFWSLLWRVKGIRTMRWPEFSGDLKKLGYDIHFGDPGPGAVMGFDTQGEGFLLTAEANWPQDFVGPIHAWIADHQKTGRCVDAKCAKCGREVYAHQSETAPLCRHCRVSTKPARRVVGSIRGVLSGLALVAVAFALTVVVAMIFPGAWVERWSGWLFMALLLLCVLVARYRSRRKKSRIES